MDVMRRRDTLFRRSLGAADVAAMCAASGLTAVIVQDGLGPAYALAGAALVFVALVKALGLYDRDEHLLHKNTLDEVPKLFGAATMFTLLLHLAGGLVIEGDFSGPPVGAFLLAFFLGLVCLRSAARALARRVAPVERCLLIGDARTAEFVADKLAVDPAVKAELVGFVPPVEPNGDGLAHDAILPRMGPALDRLEVDRVILAVTPAGRDQVLYTIRELKTHGVRVSVLPEASRIAGSSVELDHLHGMTLMGMRRFEFTLSSRLVKRSFDIAGAALALALLSPLLLVIAAGIKLTSPGPVLFRQRRVGRHGREFPMLKFRSMVVGADERKPELEHLNEGQAGLFKINDDPRVTSWGRVIRRWQLDELPQLLNVLRGEMSLVGPRPLIPEEDRKIEGWYRRRLDVPPGMTGHWQVLGSSTSIPLSEMVKLDYLYVANWSLWGDLRLLLRTVPFIAGRRGV